MGAIFSRASLKFDGTKMPHSNKNLTEQKCGMKPRKCVPKKIKNIFTYLERKWRKVLPIDFGILDVQKIRNRT